MAIAPIAGTQSPFESFMTGATGTQNILNSIIRNAQMQKKLQDAALANEQMNKYRMGELGIRRAAEGRQNKLLPYLIQSYADTHKGEMTKNELENLKLMIAKQQLSQALGEQAPENNKAALPANKSEMGNVPYSPIPGQIKSKDDLVKMLFGGQGADNYTPISPTSMNQSNGNNPGYTPINGQKPSLNDVMSMLFGNQGNGNISPNNPVSMNQPEEQNQSPYTAIPNQEPEQSGSAPVEFPAKNNPEMPSGNATPNANNEMIIKPGKKGMELADKLAGTQFGGKIVTHYGKDGSVYQQYPSGKITYSPSPSATTSDFLNSKGEGVDVKNLHALMKQIMLDNPGTDPNKANQIASAWLRDTPTLPDGTPTPQKSGVADQILTVIRNRNTPAAIKNQAANMQVLADDLNDIDITPLEKFAGLGGKANYAKYTAAMLKGEEVPQEFRDYLSFKRVTSNFAMDALRKGFGTSVVPDYVYATLGNAANPASTWWSDAKQVRNDWNTTKNWINKNAQKYTSLVKHGLTSDNNQKTESNEPKRVKLKIVNGKLVEE